MPSSSCRRRRRRRHGRGRKADGDLPPPAPVVEHGDWAALPRDVLWTVIRLLPHADVLRGAGLACASWRRVAVDEPLLWRHIDLASDDDDDALQAGRRTGWKAMARAAVDRSAGLCESFRGRADVELLLYLAYRAPSLRRLHVTCWLDMRDGRIMTRIIWKLPQLEELVVARGCVRQGQLLAALSIGRARGLRFQLLDPRGCCHTYDAIDRDLLARRQSRMKLVRAWGTSEATACYLNSIPTFPKLKDVR